MKERWEAWQAKHWRIPHDSPSGEEGFFLAWSQGHSQMTAAIQMTPSCAVQCRSLRLINLRFVLMFLALGGSSTLADNLTAFTNSLGMKFVSVPKLTNVMFSISLTRVRDFQHFVADGTNNGGYDYHHGKTVYTFKGVSINEKNESQG